MRKVQAGHVFVRNFRIYTDHFWMIEGVDQTKVVTGSRHINVGARLIGFGLKRKFVSVFLFDVVFAKIVDAFAQPLHGFIGTTASVSFGAFASTPENKNLR